MQAHCISAFIVITGMRDLLEIITYLRDLESHQCVSLGVAFGILHPKLSKMTHFPDDVVAAWIRREDNVLNTCPPTWRNLARALEQINQNGIADKVKRDHIAIL